MAATTLNELLISLLMTLKIMLIVHISGLGNFNILGAGSCIIRVHISGLGKLNISEAGTHNIRDHSSDCSCDPCIDVISDAGTNTTAATKCLLLSYQSVLPYPQQAYTTGFQ